ncbi:hypothetical protein SEA_YOSIF_22 [Streptomyces phage Yosif]|uniref:Uncharacterized protein n=1 Tax=Streptomyces phage Yosif TaxID=2201421 RepID=A0A2Z4QCE8_9CAUD|nr:hypothetical protein KGG71_gp22 [Streptomyces phage Yosif]AWY07586.1 hypothetical protein SEA_YOSIF_22 [Streptomyces phage Yosif]
MAPVPKRFFRGSAPTTQTAVYVVPTGAQGIITNIVVTNSATTAASILIRIGAIAIVPNTPIPANGVFTLDISQVMQEGTMVDVQGSSTALGVHISGVEVL